ncbi:hypothetical protein JCM10207_001914 [Rhodosporidiobolus poonsookiae]
MHSKEPLPPPGTAPKPARRSTKPLVLAGAVLLLTLFRWTGFNVLSRRPHVLQSGNIFWSYCPDSVGTYCSFLNVPLDYLNPKPDETVSLALRMIPATVPPKDQLGYLFINPGGPGGSGTGAVVDLAPLLSVVYEGRYNLLSWDPRGVNLTAPAVGCFETTGDANRWTHDLEHLGLSFEARGSPSLGYTANSSSAAELNWLSKVDAFAHSLSEACDSNANKDALRTSSTAFTARDMKSILEALGEEKINYWGFSYGTILGATFSAMFPELVGRVVLDGVSDAEKYTTNYWEWGRSGMSDTRKTFFDGFLSHCAKVGPEACAFATPNATAEQLEDRYNALLERLREAPMPIGKSAVGPGTLTPSDIEYTMFHALYQPLHWPNMASLLNETDHGFGSRLYGIANVGSSKLGRHRPTRHNPFHRAWQSFPEGTAAIMCGDTDLAPLQNTSLREFGAFMKELREESRSPTADIWAIWVSQCRHWKAKAVEAYRGPWSREKGLRKTNYPILFVSQTADPVTPLSAARKMVNAFGNDSASLVIQNGYGHCSFAHPSLCTAKRIRSYLIDGVVPSGEASCEGDPSFIFPHPDKAGAMAGALSVEDRELQHALHGLADKAGQLKMGPR